MHKSKLDAVIERMAFNFKQENHTPNAQVPTNAQDLLRALEDVRASLGRLSVSVRYRSSVKLAHDLIQIIVDQVTAKPAA